MSIDQYLENNSAKSFLLGIGSYFTFPTVQRITEKQSPTSSYQTGETLTGIVTLAAISYGLTEMTVHLDAKYYLATTATLFCTNVLSKAYEWARASTHLS